MKLNSMGLTLILLGCAIFSSFAAAESSVESLSALDTRYEFLEFKSGKNVTLPYRFFSPSTTEPETRYPLVIYLHGGGGRGTDNRKNLGEGNLYGSSTWALPENQSKHPCFVMVPQASVASGGWIGAYADAVVELIGKVKRDYAVDSDRVYVTGQSMGGIGSWRLVKDHLGLFAAAAPVCGMAHLDDVDTYIKSGVAIWAFHGTDDTTLPAAGPFASATADARYVGSRTVVDAIRDAGGSIRYTEYPGVGHVSWEKAYNEPGLVEWLFSQRRTD